MPDPSWKFDVFDARIPTEIGMSRGTGFLNLWEGLAVNSNAWLIATLIFYFLSFAGKEQTMKRRIPLIEKIDFSEKVMDVDGSSNFDRLAVISGQNVEIVERRTGARRIMEGENPERMAMSAEGQTLALTSGNFLTAFSLDGQNERKTFDLKDRITGLAVRDDGQRVGLATTCGDVREVTCDSGKIGMRGTISYEGDTSEWGLCYDRNILTGHDGRSIFSVTHDLIRLETCRRGKILTTFPEGVLETCRIRNSLGCIVIEGNTRNLHPGSEKRLRFLLGFDPSQNFHHIEGFLGVFINQFLHLSVERDSINSF